MSLEEIRSAYGEGRLGRGRGGVVVNPDGIGVRQSFQNGVVYYHRGRDVGGFVPFGPTWETWRAYGWERGRLGYPTDERPEVAPTAWFAGTTSRFEGGLVSQPRFAWVARPPLKVLWYNTALITVAYKWDDRKGHLEQLIRYLVDGDWDVVCLGEMFDNDERRAVKRALRDSHPYTHEGPMESGLHEDGGLLILSRHHVVMRGQSIYRASAGEDGLADKGVLHVRVRVNNKPGPVDEQELEEGLSGDGGRFLRWALLSFGSYEVDVYATHMQAGATLSLGSASSDARRRQARQLSSFVEATSQRRVPALVVGDFNIRLDRDAAGWMPPLSHPRDVWPLLRPDDAGETTPGGGRIDGGLLYQPYDSVWYPQAVEVGRVPARTREELSDHYPFQVTMSPPQAVRVEVFRPPARLVGRLATAHCIQTTSGPGEDDVEVGFREAGGDSEREHLGQFGTGRYEELPDRPGLRAAVSIESDPSFSLRARDEDRPWSGPEPIGAETTTIPVEHAVLMADPFSQRTPHPFPLMSDSGSRYAFRISLARAN